MNVSLTPELEKLVQQKVKSGRYQTASEVVREALRLLEARDEGRDAWIADLNRKVDEGVRAADEGRTLPAREARAALRAAKGRRAAPRR